MGLSNRYADKFILERRKKNYEAWIKQATKKFGNKFDYSLVELKYKTQKKPKVTIVCSTHGKVLMSPHDHINSQSGCMECGTLIRAKNRISNNEKNFKTKFNKLGFNKRLKLVTPYNGYKNKIGVKCLIHPNSKVSYPIAGNLISQNTLGCDECLTIHNAKKNRISQKKLNKSIQRLDEVEFEHIEFSKFYLKKKENQHE